MVANPPPHFGGAYWVFVKLSTDGGVVGFGEAYCVPFHPRVVASMIEDVCERHVVGRDPFKIEQLWRIVYSSGYSQRSDLSLMGVLSAIETACWDIVGKELDKPVYELLGGRVHEKLRSYTYIYPSEEDTSDVYADAGPGRASAPPSTRSSGLRRSSSTPWARTPRTTRGSFPWKPWTAPRPL